MIEKSVLYCKTVVKSSDKTAKRTFAGRYQAADFKFHMEELWKKLKNF